MMARAAFVLPVFVLLAACGDSLESRNAAAGLDQRGSEMTVVSQRNTPARSSQNAVSSPAAQPDAQGFADEADDDGEEPIEVDAGPETFIDSTEGFDPSPMDDTMGFDPSPMDPMAGEEV